MGNNLGKEDETTSEEVDEFLDEHPLFLSKYIDRNPDLLDNYVIANVDEVTVKGWLEKVKTPPPSAVLDTLRVDYLKEKNCTAHHTDEYIHNSLVIRRSAHFDLNIYFKNRAYLPSKDQLVLEFGVGSKPTVPGGTLVRVPVKDSLQSSKWTCMITGKDDTAKSISVQVNVPADAIIGRYKLTVEVTSELEGGKKTERKAKPDVIVLFNPFSPADDCYMEDDAQRAEFVLNDTGKVYVGQYDRIRDRDWLFGQFEEGILDIALKLLRENPRSRKDPEKSLRKRSSPVYCGRVLSAMLNSFGDDGILEGNWSGDYEDGKTPSFWSGSVKILKQWNEKKMQSVKYGQCWVFSGIFVTVLRALGIPARSVTNFASAHDTEYNMTIDKFIDENGEESDKVESYDSIWNFHVWNEAYFRRPDLPKGYDGWQALDATPQEESAGIMQCGPAPLKAIKNGEIFIGQDTNFLFSEVNADLVYWRVNAAGEVTGMICRKTRHIGRNISTKAVGSDEREDVTNQYKYPEGSLEERAAFQRAYAHGRKADYHDKFVIQEEGAITITIKTVGQDIINGKDFTVRILVENTTSESKNVKINTVGHTMLNNDERKALIKRATKTAPLAAGQVDEQLVVLPFSEYGQQLTDHNTIRFTTTVRVEETGNLYVDSYDVQVDSPQCLTIECADTMKRYEYSQIYFTITNPLPVTLTGAEFQIQGVGVTDGETVKATGPIAPGETYKSPVIEISPFRKGKLLLLADFDSKEIKNVMARKRIQVVSR